MNVENVTDSVAVANSYCKDFIRGICNRDNCRFIHTIPPKSTLRQLFKFCHDFQNMGCYRPNCKFIHASMEQEEIFFETGEFPKPHLPPSFMNGLFGHLDKKEVNIHVNVPPPSFGRPPPPNLIHHGNEDNHSPEAKRRYIFNESSKDSNNSCDSCETLGKEVKLLRDNLNFLLKRVGDLTEKNAQLTSMNEFLLEQTASVRNDQPCVITSQHTASAPVSLATVNMAPVSLAGALPALVPAAATPNLALTPAASRAQLLTSAPQILTVSTNQQLMGSSGALIVTSAGAQQLMQVSDSGTLMGGGQTVVAVPAQIAIAPSAPQLISNGPTSVQQLVASHAPAQYAAPAQLSAQQSQQLAAQQSAQQQLAAAQQSAQQQLAAAQQSAQQQLAAAQQSGPPPPRLVPAAQLVHQTSTQQITISSTSMPNAQAQPLTFPIIGQSIMPH